MSKLSAAVDYLRQELGEDPTAESISEEVGMTPEKVAGLMHVVQQPISLETTLGNDDEHTPRRLHRGHRRDLAGRERRREHHAPGCQHAA